MNKEHPLLSWQFMLLKLAIFGLVAVFLQQPAGTIKGRLALEMPGFGLHSYDVQGNSVYVLANGTGPIAQVERGVWVKGDGSFEINQLPKGEYSVMARAPGFENLYKYSIFVNDGAATDLGDVDLNAIKPSVRIASNARVFTSKEDPHFWLSTSGADQATVKIYRFNALDLSVANPPPNSKGTSTQQPENTLSAENLADLKLSASGTALEIYKPYGAKDPLSKLTVTPLVTMERSLHEEGDHNDWARADFKLEKKLPAGDYMVTAEVVNSRKQTDWNIYWFSVSDLGLIVKNDGQKLVARAIDLNTLKPKQNANVEIYSRNNKARPIAIKGKTGANGFIEVSLSQYGQIQGFSSIVVASLAGQHAYGGIWAGRKDTERYRTFCYTERPVYRLGQTVYFKTIVREKKGNALTNPGAGLDVSVNVTDPDSNSIWEKDLETNDHGTFNGTFELPADGKTGAYQITMTYPDNTVATESFEILEYRKPEYEVTVTPAQERIVAGQKGKARVKARYYFGAPVSNANIKYTLYSSTDYMARYRLMPRPSYMSYYDDWEDDTEPNQQQSSDSYGGDYISEGTAHTDQNGEAIIEFDTKRPQLTWDAPGNYDYTDQRYKVQVEVTDLSRMTVIGSTNCSVVIGDFDLFLNDDSYVISAGQPIGSHLTVIDQEGKPVANQKVTIALCRWPYDSTDSKYKPKETVAQKDVVTDNDGKAVIQFDTDKTMATDTYYLTALATDSGGREIFTQDSFWIASHERPFFYFGNQASTQAVSIKLDKQVYKVGETAKAMITAPVTGTEGIEAIVSLEADSLIKYWTIPLDASAKMVEVPIEQNYEPNIFLSVTFVSQGHVLHTQSKMIKVSPENHNLNLAIKPAKDKYKPGETADFTIKASLPNGSPAANAEVSLGLVDESVYAIRPDDTPDIVKTFYPKRANQVETICSFPETYSGGPDKTNEPRMRKDFRDTAGWLPNLRTDQEGVVVAHVKLPDNLTTWRATVRGCGSGENFGATVGKIVSSQDLIVRLALPRFFTVGDEGYISALVQNYTDREQTVKLNLSLSKAIQTSDRLEQRVTVKPNVTARYSWPAKITQPGEATISVKAVGQTAGDAMERKLPIVALGIPAFSAKSGVLTGDPQTVTIPWQVAGESVPGSVKYVLKIAPSSIGPVLGNFDSLIEYPYGCTEQTMSRLTPSVVALTLHKYLGLPLDNKLKKRFDKVYKMSMDKLTSYQHDDGGWGWWQTDESNLYLTALVLEGFKELEKVDYKVDPAKQKAGLDWLNKGSLELRSQLDKSTTKVNEYELNEDCIDLAKACYVVALYGQKPDSGLVEFLTKRVSKLSPEALAYLAMAEKISGSQAIADQAYKQMLFLANRPENMVDWEPTKQLLKRMAFPISYGDYSYRFTGVETTALALRAILTMDPNNSTLIESVKNWLLAQRGEEGWDNTKTTSQVFLALLEEQLSFAKGAVQSPSIRISEGKQLVEQMSWAVNQLYGPETVIKPPPQIDQGENSGLTLTKEGAGRVYYSSLLTYQRLLKPGENVDGMSMPSDLRLQRNFSRISVAATTTDGKIHFHATDLKDGTVRAGETILMKVKLKTPTSVPYVIVECGLPSGAEVVQGDSKANNLDGDSNQGDDSDSPFAGDWQPQWWTHQDVLDDRIVFFVTNLPAGNSEFDVMLRMEMPGTFEINPIKLEGMYTDKVRGYSPPGVMKVVE
jgi:alpha-2-macroglobulin